MTITLRERKQGKSNKIALYLDIYKGTKIDKNGKTKYLREYEFLNLYLIANPKTDEDKTQNKDIKQLAKNIKNQRELELHTRKHGFSTKNDYKYTNFYQYFYNIAEKKVKETGNKTWNVTLNNFRKFATEDVVFEDITEKFCSDYMQYLQNIKSFMGTPFKKSSVNSYFVRFASVVRQAIKEKIITTNPLINTPLLKQKKVEKIYLTLDELKALVKTECNHKEIKRAFIFSCLTGLRWSDVFKLKWSEIQVTDGKYLLIYTQKKTKELNYLPLSEQAVFYLGERKLKSELVFKLPIHTADISKRLQKWCSVAGVEKKITYHSSRHTFAVLQLSHGTPVFTVQKLLGHTDIASTMVYANIVDSEKEKAMNIIPSIL